MVSYEVGDSEQSYEVDHPPIFACRSHRQLLRLTPRFIEEMLSVAQDVMPGTLDELGAAFLPDSAEMWRSPDWLLPPKVVLFNPQNLRGAPALPYVIVRVGSKFFGLPARYLTPDRFDGCDECRRRPPPPPRRRKGPTPRPGRRPPPQQRDNRRPRPGARDGYESGRRQRLGDGPPPRRRG